MKKFKYYVIREGEAIPIRSTNHGAALRQARRKYGDDVSVMTQDGLDKITGRKKGEPTRNHLRVKGI